MKDLNLNSLPRNVCSPKPDCSGEQKFRTMDGTCNSLSNPLRGALKII